MKWIKRISFRSKRKGKMGSAKFLYITDQQYIYQLVTSPDNPDLNDRLGEFYRQLEVLRPERHSAIAMYLTILAACLLSRFELLSGFNAAGIQLIPVAIKHVLLAAYSFAQLRLGLAFSKYGYIAGIFDTKYARSRPYERADLLARYPLAFDALKYFVGQIGFLPHMATMRTQKRMIAILLILSASILIYVLFSTWLVISLALDVWQSASSLPSILSKATVAISGLTLLGSYCLPYERLFKRAHMHIGLVKMLNRAYENDRPRYLKYQSQVQRIKKQTEGAE